jgi:hypothetical protein
MKHLKIVSKSMPQTAQVEKAFCRGTLRKMQGAEGKYCVEP